MNKDDMMFGTIAVLTVICILIVIARWGHDTDRRTAALERIATALEAMETRR